MTDPAEGIPEDKTSGKKNSKRLDFGTLAGLAVALLGMVGGLLLEGGELRDISQFTAALIVFGGALGATLVSTPIAVMLRASKHLGAIFFENISEADAVVEQIIQFATRARKNGVVSLEREADRIENPFLRKAVNLAVDGTDLQEIRKMLELDTELEEHRQEAEAKVFEAAGGYSPTIGIIGAVMGLIQVMKNLADIEKVGHGIAVSFVATVYGVGVANIVLLPIANKIRARAHQETQVKELIIEGIIGIVEGMNPKLIRSKLEAYGGAEANPKKKASKAAPLPAAGQEA